MTASFITNLEISHIRGTSSAEKTGVSCDNPITMHILKFLSKQIIKINKKQCIAQMSLEFL
jgi:hypothetical protein